MIEWYGEGTTEINKRELDVSISLIFDMLWLSLRAYVAWLKMQNEEQG